MAAQASFMVFLAEMYIVEHIINFSFMLLALEVALEVALFAYIKDFKLSQILQTSACYFFLFLVSAVPTIMCFSFTFNSHLVMLLDEEY